MHFNRAQNEGGTTFGRGLQAEEGMRGVGSEAEKRGRRTSLRPAFYLFYQPSFRSSCLAEELTTSPRAPSSARRRLRYSRGPGYCPSPPPLSHLSPLFFFVVSPNGDIFAARRHFLCVLARSGLNSRLSPRQREAANARRRRKVAERMGTACLLIAAS